MFVVGSIWILQENKNLYVFTNMHMVRGSSIAKNINCSQC